MAALEVQLPEQGHLANGWEQCCPIRHLLRSDGRLLRWPSVKLTGVPSKRSVNLNEQVLQVATREWAQVCPVPKGPPISWLKAEAGLLPRATLGLYTPLSLVKTR